MLASAQSSVADVAFLLLVFFMIISNVKTNDYGISTSIDKEGGKTQEYNDKVTEVWLNSAGQIVVAGEEVSKSGFKTQILKNMDPSEDVRNVIMLKSKNDVSYPDFLSVLDLTKQSFKTFHSEIAKKSYSMAYEDLQNIERNEIVSRHPVALMEDVLD